MSVDFPVLFLILIKGVSSSAQKSVSAAELNVFLRIFARNSSVRLPIILIVVVLVGRLRRRRKSPGCFI